MEFFKKEQLKNVEKQNEAHRKSAFFRFFRKQKANHLPEEKKPITKISISLKSYRDIFSDFEEESTPLVQREISKDFLAELMEKISHRFINGSLVVELSIPKHIRKAEKEEENADASFEEQVINRIKSHFRWDVQSLMSEMEKLHKKGLNYLKIGAPIMSFYTLIEGLAVKSVQNPLTQAIIAAILTPIQILGWFFVFMGYEKYFDKSAEAKEKIEMKQKFAEAEYVFVPRTKSSNPFASEKPTDAA